MRVYEGANGVRVALDWIVAVGSDETALPGVEVWVQSLLGEKIVVQTLWLNHSAGGPPDYAEQNERCRARAQDLVDELTVELAALAPPTIEIVRRA